jgi:hypothetical protein
VISGWNGPAAEARRRVGVAGDSAAVASGTWTAARPPAASAQRPGSAAAGAASRAAAAQ